MSWMQMLCGVYEAAGRAGLVGREVAGQETLLPICHMTVQAALEVTVTPAGDFVRAEVIEGKEQQTTVIPCTEEAASRTRGVAAFPFCDKLSYVAGDCARLLPPSEKGKDLDEPFRSYQEALKAWCDSGHAHPDVESWYRYAQKRRLLRDLADSGVLLLGQDGRILQKADGKEKPALYRAVAGDPVSAFVRIRVQHPDEDRTWMNPEVYESFIAYQRSVAGETGLCYASGQEMPLSASSPKFIRYPGDGTKLISSNEKTFIVFRGRFATAGEALSLGRETNEKAHAALKWLIRRQAWRNGDQVILAFAGDGGRTPSPAADTVALMSDPLAELGIDIQEPFTTGEALAQHVREALSGYRCRLTPDERAVVMGLDSATPGRLSIFYYRELSAEDLFTRVCGWHSTCSWRHAYRSVPDGTDDSGKQKYRRVVFTGAPAPADIIKAAYGENVSDKLLKSGVERLLPCVVDGAPVPVDLMKSAARRATQQGLTPFEQNKALSVACALIRKRHNDQQQKEVWTMALQPEVNDRSYLFGRALAYAERIERRALRANGESRSTNAERLKVAFSKHPAKTWKVLMERLEPYRQRLGGKAAKAVSEMEQVIDRLQTEGFTNEPLSELYCLGYASQRQRFADDYQEYLLKKAAGKPVDPDELDDDANSEEE